MKNTILIDTNILLDFIQDREPYKEEARMIFDLCFQGKIRGTVSTQSVADAFYICRKDLSLAERREIFLSLVTLYELVDVTGNMIISGLHNDQFQDFEDCIQSECAKSVKADYIVTRNPADFAYSEIKAITPKDYLTKYAEQ